MAGGGFGFEEKQASSAPDGQVMHAEMAFGGGVVMIGTGEPLVGRLLLYDALAMRFRELKLRRSTECPVCGDNPTIKELIDYEEFCGAPMAATGG